MCVPNAVSAVVNSAVGLVNKAIEVDQQSKEFKYRQQLAINNAKRANNEALRQKQLGIDEARKEKIQGIQEANRQKAINSAINFDLNSETLNNTYEDIINQYKNQAKTIENSYNMKSNQYFTQANSYLNQAKQANDSYKNYILKTSINSLDDFGQVSSEWYSKEVNYDHF